MLSNGVSVFRVMPSPRRVAFLATAAAAIVTYGLPAHVQDDKCGKFQSLSDQETCRRELQGTQPQPPLEPYCLPIAASQWRAIRSGQRVVVRGVDGCFQVWNDR